MVVGPECGKGYQVNSKGTGCSHCPRGSYKDTDDNNPCINCPPGETTIFYGVTSSSQCIPGRQLNIFMNIAEVQSGTAILK